MEKVILDIKPKSIIIRLFLKDYLLILFISIISLVYFDINIFIKITLIFISSIIILISELKEYKYFTYRISSVNEYLIINYLKWNKDEQLIINIKESSILKEKRARVRGIIDQILIVKGNNRIYTIYPEMLFFRTWTEERVSELYDKLIETQNEVKARYENENIGS